MSCSPFDLKDFIFGELNETERRQVAAHVGGCRECQEEVDRLRLTQAALHALHDEEVPRRIAFVSDQVFEPRWWQSFWRSAPRLGFASAAMLAVAILVLAFVRPVLRVPSPAAEPAAVEARVRAEVVQRVQSAVQAAVAESEARQASRTAALVDAVRKELESQRQADRVQFREVLEYWQRKYNMFYTSALYQEGGRP